MRLFFFDVTQQISIDVFLLCIIKYTLLHRRHMTSLFAFSATCLLAGFLRYAVFYYASECGAHIVSSVKCLRLVPEFNDLLLLATVATRRPPHVRR